MILGSKHKLVSGLLVLAIGTITLSGCGGSGQTENANQATSGNKFSAQSANGTADSKTSSDIITVGLTYVPNVQFSPVYMAEALGIFDQSGTEVSVRHHGSEEGLFTALVAGDEQITVASGDEVLQARAQGADIIAIGAYYHKYPVEVIVPAKSEIKSFADLKGKKVGLPGEFGSNWFGLQAGLESAGLSVDDITVVSVGYTQAAALVSGEVDAIVGFVNSEAVQLTQLDFATNSISLDSGTPLIGATIVSTEKWVEAHPAEAKSVVAGITAGAQAVIDDPTKAVEQTAKWDDTLTDDSAKQGALATLNATIPLLKDSKGKASSVQDLEAWLEMGPFLANILKEPDLGKDISVAVTNAYTG